jgi:hypothetical protein
LVTPSAQKAEKVRGDIAIASREVANVEARVKDMDRLGVSVQVIYPTLFLVYITDDPELDTALAKAYNSWLGDACAKSNGRLKFVAVLPLRSIPESLKEMKRLAISAGGIFRHRGGQDPIIPIFIRSTSRPLSGSADQHSHRIRRAVDATVLRACAEPYLCSWAGAADFRFPGFAR